MSPLSPHQVARKIRRLRSQCKIVQTHMFTACASRIAWCWPLATYESANPACTQWTTGPQSNSAGGFWTNTVTICNQDYGGTRLVLQVPFAPLHYWSQIKQKKLHTQDAYTCSIGGWLWCMVDVRTHCKSDRRLESVSLYPSECVSVCLPTCLSIYRPIYPSNHPSIHLSANPSAVYLQYLSLQLPVYLPSYLSI